MKLTLLSLQDFNGAYFREGRGPIRVQKRFVEDGRQVKAYVTVTAFSRHGYIMRFDCFVGSILTVFKEQEAPALEQKVREWEIHVRDQIETDSKIVGKDFPVDVGILEVG